ncbi:hypothetical protein Tco_1285245 [Tanacetum coccineum]
MTVGVTKKAIIAGVRVMNYLIQAYTIRYIQYSGMHAKKAAKESCSFKLLLSFKCFFIHSMQNLLFSQNILCQQHPPSVVDYDDEYQGELQGDSQEDKLTTAIMLLARAISQKFSTPTNNRLRVSLTQGFQA